jgi:hypothetical protein
MTAEADRRAAQAAYLGILSKAWALGVQGLLEKLETMRDKGERVTSFLELVSLWIREIDQAGHVAMQSEAGLAATAAAVRATNRQRAELQRLVALVSLALNVPTRAEVDDGFREIQELKREIRRLKRNSVQIPTGIAPEKVVTQNRINKRQAAASSNGHGASAKRSRSTTAKGVRS